MTWQLIRNRRNRDVRLVHLATGAAADIFPRGGTVDARRAPYAATLPGGATREFPTQRGALEWAKRHAVAAYNGESLPPLPASVRELAKRRPSSMIAPGAARGHLAAIVAAWQTPAGDSLAALQAMGAPIAAGRDYLNNAQ